jgi:hypothetical protein
MSRTNNKIYPYKDLFLHIEHKNKITAYAVGNQGPEFNSHKHVAGLNR